MNESEMVKMMVVLIPSALAVISGFIGWIIEEIRNRHSADLFKDEEAMKLLRYMREDD